MSNGHLYLDESALEIVKEVYDLGGGTEVVTELPEVGEPHTVYELHTKQTKPYGTVASILNCMGSFVGGDLAYVLIFDTQNQMVNTITPLENSQGRSCVAYIKNENRMFYIGYKGEWLFIEMLKATSIFGDTDYAFEDGGNVFYILKSFEGNRIPVADGGWEYKATTLDDVEVYLRQNSQFGFMIKDIVKPNYGTMFSFLNVVEDATVSELPNAEELETNYLNYLICGNGTLMVFNSSNGKYYQNVDGNQNYYWYNGEYGTYFANNEEEVPGHAPTRYTGELGWNEVPFDAYPVCDEIPYQEIINSEEESVRIFKPHGDEDKISYWYYSNDEWVNMDTPTSNGTVLGITSVVNGDMADSHNKRPLSDFGVMVDDVELEIVQLGEEEPIAEDYVYTCYGYIKDYPMPTVDNNAHTVTLFFKNQEPSARLYTAYVNYGSLPKENIFDANGSVTFELFYLSSIVIQYTPRELP